MSRCRAQAQLILLLIFALAAGAAADDTYVRINRVGYQLSQLKIAVAMGRSALSDTFEVVDATTKKVVLKHEANPSKEAWGEFKYHARLDFSAVKQEGEYYVRMGDAKSATFPIQDWVYSELPDQLLGFMRQQRCGYNPWADAVCHSYDGRTVDGPLPPGSYVDARGGWHDAGDQLKYLLTTSNATAQMLLAYRLGKERKSHVEFADRVNELGQSQPNGIPDLLDEARWGLDWMLRLHPARDQLYHQVADDRDHSNGFRLPQDEKVDYGWGAGRYRPVYSADGKPQGLKEFKSESTGVANLAGRYAAAMALGYQIWKDDRRLKPYAERLLTSGKEVYAMGTAQEGVQQGNSYKAPYRYAETTWADDMEWGAAELLRATGEAQYRTDALRYAELAGRDGWFGKEKTGHYQYYPFMNLGHYRLHDLVDDAERKKLAGYYKSENELCVKVAQKQPFRIGVPFIWCSNNLVVALATQCKVYEWMTGDKRYQSLGAAQRDWLAGANPWGYSMFSGVPARNHSPQDVHLFGNAVLKRTVRGGLVDGPVARSIFRSLKGVSIREPDPLAAFQDERAVYHDDIGDYSTNEPTMDGTASAILLWVVTAAE